MPFRRLSHSNAGKDENLSNGHLNYDAAHGSSLPGEPAFMHKLPSVWAHRIRQASNIPLWRPVAAFLAVLLATHLFIRGFVRTVDYVKLTRIYLPEYTTIPPITQEQIETARYRHITMDQCISKYPGLYDEADRVAKYWSKRGGVTMKDIEKSADRGQTARVLIYNGEMYVRRFEWERHSRSRATLALIQEAILTSIEPIPNVEFVIHTDDQGEANEHLPLWVLDRTTKQHHLWLMPDFGFGSWPEPKVGTYSEVVRKANDYEKRHPWDKKIPQLFWKGALMVDVRRKLVEIGKKYSWSKVEEVDWRDKATVMTMDDHCGFKFLGHVEGFAYSGRLKYILQCRSVVVAHEMEYIQHFHHLINSTMGAPGQNMVVVPGMDWKTLPETMDALIDDDAFAEDLADRSRRFWQHYISKQSIDCYWRYMFQKWAELQKFTPELRYEDTPYESFALLGRVHWDPY